MASNKLASWRTNYCRKYWPIMNNTLPDTPKDYGYTKQDQLHSHFLWMTLQSSTWEKKMHTIGAMGLLHHYEITTD
jgi:hypothetical protein